MPHRSAISVRSELPDDYDSIRSLNDLAFGGPNEGMLIDGLRRREDFIPDLSLVAVDDGRIVGHILFSPISIRTASGAVPALGLAPMAVAPDVQRRGIGGMLVRHGLQECVRLGHRIVVVLGHKDYYPRFGFVPASPLGIHAPFDVADPYFMVRELQPGAIAVSGGTVEYPPEFDSV